jgi:hypothetical protein
VLNRRIFSFEGEEVVTFDVEPSDLLTLVDGNVEQGDLPFLRMRRSDKVLY